MARTAVRPGSADLYQRDLYSRSLEQARSLRERHLGALQRLTGCVGQAFQGEYIDGHALVSWLEVTDRKNRACERRIESFSQVERRCREVAPVSKDFQ